MVGKDDRCISHTTIRRGRRGHIQKLLGETEWAKEAEDRMAGVGLYEGEVFFHPIKDLSPSLALELLSQVILSQFSKMGSIKWA
jgi:hypothetical protein